MKIRQLINLSLVEGVEITNQNDGKVNIKLLMSSGKEKDNLYTDMELAEKQYEQIRTAMGNCIEYSE